MLLLYKKLPTGSLKPKKDEAFLGHCNGTKWLSELAKYRCDSYLSRNVHTRVKPANLLLLLLTWDM